MNCLEFRRRLLATPRERSFECEAHLSSCGSCGGFSRQLGKLERSTADAFMVRVPDALAYRVLLRRCAHPTWRYAAAAIFGLVSIAGGLFAAGLVEAPGLPETAIAVGPSHPAVAAIAEVTDEDHPLVSKAVSPSPTEVADDLKRAGLALKDETEVSAQYVGKCHIYGIGECAHIVLSTGAVQANVMVMTDYSLARRMLVSDRHLVALASPAPSGSYIVVADSASAAKRIEKLLVRG